MPSRTVEPYRTAQRRVANAWRPPGCWRVLLDNLDTTDKWRRLVCRPVARLVLRWELSTRVGEVTAERSALLSLAPAGYSAGLPPRRNKRMSRACSGGAQGRLRGVVLGNGESAMKQMTSLVVALIAMMGLGTRSDASVMVFTDRASWNAAVGGFLHENFDALPVTDFVTGINSAGLVRVEITGDPGLNGIQDASSSFDINSTNFYRGEVDTSGSDAGSAALLFSTPMIGFAADYTRTTDFDHITVTLGATTLNFDLLLPFPGDGFLGFVSTVAFRRVDFATELTGLNEVFGLDNLSFAPAAAAVPEPASFSLFLLGGITVGGFVWRRRRHTTTAS